MQVGVSIPRELLEEIKGAVPPKKSLSAFLLELIEAGWESEGVVVTPDNAQGIMDSVSKITPVMEGNVQEQVIPLGDDAPFSKKKQVKGFGK